MSVPIECLQKAKAILLEMAKTIYQSMFHTKPKRVMTDIIRILKRCFPNHFRVCIV